jgi:hypothetical protein
MSEKFERILIIIFLLILFLFPVWVVYDNWNGPLGLYNFKFFLITLFSTGSWVFCLLVYFIGMDLQDERKKKNDS